ncbi:hypothetical protein OE88DRAFT_352220 [Heliocybe sulcata]|uniref:Uncharacterized protein n=1 Tax=Heliocybe sulcata TaxID=5364 RepID=A0A5C3MW45_9AGAM|nr:hypothetical protein OE88DRAFT_352220 [Heliocybe sulcata]
MSHQPTVPREQQDEVVPLFAMDLFKFAQAFTVTLKIVVNGTMDINVLTSSLDLLVSRGHWRKVGARIRRTEKGSLEWHIPRRYNKERPACLLTSDIYDTPSSAGLHIPTATPIVPSIQRDLGPDHLFIHSKTPMTMADYLDPAHDRPCLSIHVTAFRDNSVTCIGITLPHIFGDGAGIAQVLHAWFALIRDPEAAIPALSGFDKDPFAPIEAAYDFSGESLYTPTTEAANEDAVYSLRLQEEFEKYPRETRTVYVPPRMAKQMHYDALLELKRRKAAGEDVPDYLSEQGVITAWWIKTVFGSDTDDSTPLITFVGSSLRKTLTGLFPRNTVYPHNATLSFASEPIPLRSVKDLSVADIAIASRKAMLRETSDLSTLERAVALKLWNNRVSSVPLSVAAHATWHFTTTMKDAQGFDMDFSRAIIAKARGEIGDGHPGSVRAVSGTFTLNSPFPARSMLAMVGKDKEGGYWLQPTLRREDRMRLTVERLAETAVSKTSRAKL